MEFVTFDRFPNKEMAEDLGKFLESKGIDYVIEDDSPNLDSSFTGSFAKEFRLKLRHEDFDKAHSAVEESVLGELDKLPQDYYLLSFSDEELIEVVSAKDEWNAFDYMLARKLLKDKGKEISQEEIKVLENRRIETLSKPDKPDKSVNFIGWIAVVLGGFLGLLIGWYLNTHKKTLPNGQLIHAYSENDRKNGRAMIRWSLFSLVFWIVLNFVRVWTA